MKSHGKSKAVLSAIIFEVNLLQSSRFGEALRIVQDKLNSNDFFYMSPNRSKDCNKPSSRPMDRDMDKNMKDCMPKCR